MILHRLLTEVQRLCNLLMGASPSRQLQDLKLPWGDGRRDGEGRERRKDSS